MLRRTRYYALVASLPFLPRIRRAERLPINEQRLDERLRMLTPEDAAVVERVLQFIRWENQLPDQTDADVAARYGTLLEENPQPAVRSAIEFRMDLRTVLGALRHRQRGETEPPQGHDWGVGHWVRHIESNWSHPEFKLAQIFPWIPEARQHLENAESLALEELAMNLVWDALDRSALGKYFELETIIAYLFKWDILRRWLSYNEDSAATHFEELTESLFPGPSAAPHPPTP